MIENSLPKVSVVIPVYNGSNYLKEAINSALAQTYKNVEIVVINDGSNDNGKTEEIALSYGDKIRYFYKENGGVASALNFGIEKMTGEYFSWLSHDDIYYPEKIEKQINYLLSLKNDSIIYSDYENIDSEKRFISSKKVGEIPPEKFRYYLLVNGSIHGCTLLIPKICFEKTGLFNTDLKTTQDMEMWFRMSRKFKFCYLPEILVKSRVHPEQGTKVLTDIVTQECNQLLYNFFISLSDEDLKYGAETKFLPIAYLKIIKNLHRRGFYLARNRIIKKIKSNLKKNFLEKNIFKRFENYYLKNTFNSKESHSGEGSTLEQTKIIRKEIPMLLKKLNIKIFLDAPCGDLNWMKEIDFSGIKYIGVDIVEQLIEENSIKYKSLNREFKCLDITRDSLPYSDIIMCRDCLVHLTFSEAKKAILNMKKSGAKYFLTTTFVNRKENEELIGVWRPLNMEKAPFYFPPPIILINEGCSEADNQFQDKCLGLWRFEDIEV